MYDDNFEPDWVSPPGDTVRDLLEERALLLSDLALSLKLSIEEVSGLLSGTLPLSETIAINLEGLFSVSRQFWITREQHYRESLVKSNKMTQPLKGR